MFSSLSRNDLGGSSALWVAIKLLMLASICAGWAAEAHAQADVKKSVVRIVTSGTRIAGPERAEPVEAYEGSGFIVYSKEVSGGAQTVIVTADHVLGYSQSKAHHPSNVTFKTGEVRGAPPVWVNRGDKRCLAELRIDDSSEPCRRIEIFYREKGRWVPYNTEVHVHWEGDKNRDAAVLRLKFAHDDQRGLKMDSGFSLDEAAQRSEKIPLPPLMAWGIESGRPENDPFMTQLTYRARNDGPTLLFQTTVKPGNSGGPIMFQGKVISIVSAVQGDETRGTNISAVHDAVRNWDIPVDRVPAYRLMRQIRCETHYAIRGILIEWLSSMGERGARVPAILSRQYQADPDLISTFNPSLFKGLYYSEVRKVVTYFHSIGIAYAFESYPQFTITDTFVDLLTINQPNRYGERYCDEFSTSSGSRLAGMDRLMRDFVDLTVLSGRASRVPTVVDVLSYTPSAGRTTHAVTVALATSAGGKSEALAVMAIDKFKNRPAQ
jgi:hypothetical protein